MFLQCFRNDIDDHLDAMQTDLESLKELLRSDSYSLDTNTLIGVRILFSFFSTYTIAILYYVHAMHSDWLIENSIHDSNKNKRIPNRGYLMCRIYGRVRAHIHNHTPPTLNVNNINIGFVRLVDWSKSRLQSMCLNRVCCLVLYTHICAPIPTFWRPVYCTQAGTVLLWLLIKHLNSFYHYVSGRW